MAPPVRNVARSAPRGLGACFFRQLSCRKWRQRCALRCAADTSLGSKSIHRGIPMNQQMRLSDPRQLTFLTALSLRLCSLTYVVIFAVLAYTSRNFPASDVDFRNALLGVIGVLAAVSIVGHEVVIRGLRRGRTWAWVTALVLSSVYAVSGAMVPFGVMGIYSLARKSVRAAFGIGRSKLTA